MKWNVSKILLLWNILLLQCLLSQCAQWGWRSRWVAGSLKARPCRKHLFEKLWIIIMPFKGSGSHGCPTPSSRELKDIQIACVEAAQTLHETWSEAKVLLLLAFGHSLQSISVAYKGGPVCISWLTGQQTAAGGRSLQCTLASTADARPAICRPTKIR